VFERSLQFARQTGYLKGHQMKTALDTSYILGYGAVKDTYNLLADGIVQVVRALSALDGVKTQCWANERSLECYFGSSIKGEAAINGNDEKAIINVQKGWRKHVTIYLNKPIDSLPVRLTSFLHALSLIRKECSANPFHDASELGP